MVLEGGQGGLKSKTGPASSGELVSLIGATQECAIFVDTANNSYISHKKLVNCIFNFRNGNHFHADVAVTLSKIFSIITR